MLDVIKEFEGKVVSISMTTRERVRGTLSEIGPDYIMITREQMTPLYLSLRYLVSIA
jgi:hypothetical protein